jgi:hypothetical protein
MIQPGPGKSPFERVGIGRSLSYLPGSQKAKTLTKHSSKAALLKDIRTERRLLEKNLAVLTRQEIIQLGVVGAWSVKDVLAHLAAWEQLFLDWYETGLQEKTPESSPVGMNRKAIDALNQRIFVRYQNRSVEDVLAEFQTSYQRILTTCEAIPEENMFAEGRYAWTGKLTLADYIAGNTCNHYRWARTKIRKWLKARINFPAGNAAGAPPV